MMPEGPGGAPQRLTQRLMRILNTDPARLGTSGVVVAGWWIWPLLHRQGVYGGGHYSFPGIALGVVLGAWWLAAFITALCPRPKRRAVGIRLGVALGSLIVTSICCDIGYVGFLLAMSKIKQIPISFSYQLNTHDDELIIRHRPLVHWRGQRSPDCDVVEFRTDEEGFRNPPGSRQADIVFLGDSVTEAGEVHEDATFVRQTAKQLGRTALNLGVFSYGPQQELVVLNRFGLAHKPKAVVWQVTEWNDLNDAQVYPARGQARERQMRWREVYERHSPLVALTARVFPPRPEHLVAFAKSDGTIDHRSLWPYQNLVPTRAEGLKYLLESIAQARNLCRERGIDFVVLFVPDQVRVLSRYVRYANERERKYYEGPEGIDPADDLSHVLASLCQALDCPLVDLTEPLRQRAAEDNRYVYVRNDTHLGHAGHEVAAACLAHVLAAQPRIADNDKRPSLQADAQAAKNQPVRK